MGKAKKKPKCLCGGNHRWTFKVINQEGNNKEAHVIRKYRCVKCGFKYIHTQTIYQPIWTPVPYK